MKPEEAWQNLKEKFTSSNDVSVERNSITREEYEAILEEHQNAIANLKCMKHLEIKQ